MAMYGSGAAIGMAITVMAAKAIRKERLQGRPVCAAAVAGTSLRSIAGRRTASATHQSTATTSLASASFSPSKQWKTILLSKEKIWLKRGRDDRVKSQ